MTAPAPGPEALAAFPRLGWAHAPTPITHLATLGDELGLAWLGIKRDDLCAPLHGGSKTRKLDFLLASPPWRDAAGWSAMGAIGSGQLVACAAAASLLDRRLRAHVFWEPLSAGVLDNLAHTASHAAELSYHRSRISLALTAPGVLLGRGDARWATIPPGATCLPGNLGLVRAGLELGEQVRAGLLPEPEVLYVALGSGGTAAGLAVGLGWAGLRTRVRAVATVERVFTSRRRLRGLIAELLDALRGTAAIVPAPVDIVRDHLGGGYGVASPAALAAVARLQAFDIELEAVYTGKAMAALLFERGTVQGSALFWQTARRPLPPPKDDWQAALPKRLRARLDRGPADPRRRRLLLAGGAVAGVALTWRLMGPASLRRWRGRVLSGGEAAILLSFAEALLQPLPGHPGLRRVVLAADHYVAGLPEAMRGDVGLALRTVEQASVVRGHLGSCASLRPEERLAVLRDLHDRGGLLRDAARCVRDLCLLGYYQQAAAWPKLGYPGPKVPAGRRPTAARYARLLAPPGQLPKGATPDEDG